MLEVLRRVFRSLDAFDEPFQPTIESRLLVFPTNGFALTERQFDAIAAAVLNANQSEGYVIVTEGVSLNETSTELDCHSFRFDSFMSYLDLINTGALLQENAITSATGNWGILVSQESHAIVGGQPAFVTVFQRNYGENNDDLGKFVAAWKGNEARINSDISWMPKLLRHLHHD